MEDMISNIKSKHSGILIRKALAVILVGVFLSSYTLSWAKEEELFLTGMGNNASSSSPATQNNKLAPPSKLDSEDFKYSLTVGAICKHVEHDGNLDDRSYLNDVLARLDADKNHNITVLPYEIIIEIPNEGLAIRYFDPTKANVITPYSDISKLSTKVIGPRLNRQIIHRVRALPKDKKLNLASVDNLREAFSKGVLLNYGMSILMKNRPGLHIETPSDVSKYNSSVTNFDISLLPLLERTPKAILSDEDWGIYAMSGKGVEYRNKKESEFVPFTEQGQRLIGQFLKEHSEEYFSAGLDKLTAAMLTCPFFPADSTSAANLKARGLGLLERTFADGREKINNFLQAGLSKNQSQGDEGTIQIYFESICVVAGLLDRLPRMLQEGAFEEGWYWVPAESGIEFVDRRTGKREFVEYSRNPEIANFPEARKVRHILTVLKKISADRAINTLDELILHNEAGPSTEYDKYRCLIEKRFGDRFPLVYDHYAVNDGVARREGIPAIDVVNHRFTLRELQLIYSSLNLFPAHLIENRHDRYHSYRPGMLECFTQTWGYDSASFCFAPLAMRKGWMLEKIIRAKEITGYLAGLTEAQLVELSYARINLHEKAHGLFKDLFEERQREYAAISWDMGSWKYSSADKMKDGVKENLDKHFLITYALNENSSGEDFADHVTAYMLFGPQFRADVSIVKGRALYRTCAAVTKKLYGFSSIMAFIHRKPRGVFDEIRENQQMRYIGRSEMFVVQRQVNQRLRDGGFV